MSARDVIAKQIEPQAWAALGVGDTIAYRNRRVSSERKADRIIAALNTGGYEVLSPDEVRGIRNEALEEAARASDEHPGVKFTNHNGRQDWRPPCRVEIAAAIRSLKGGRDAQ